MTGNKHPIIAHGELYVEPITKKTSGGPKKIPHEYHTAKNQVIADIDRIFEEIKIRQEIFLDEKVVCVRMEPKFEAKSYVPEQLIADESMSFVGGRKYSFSDEHDEEHSAKLYFIKTDDNGIRKLRQTLSLGNKDNVEAWRKQIGSIHSLDLLRPEEKTMGFPDDWKSGTVEIILHPLKNEHDKMLKLFYETTKIPVESTRVKTYEDGLTFISAKCNLAELEHIKKLNPLRAVHPLGRIGINPVRTIPNATAPQLAASNKKSLITVGVFDGGTDNTIPLLKGHVKAYDCVPTKSDLEYVSHGAAVCSAVLHGNLAGKSNADTLPTPPVSVESYRVLPIQDENDFELYEAIDAIEEVVKTRSDIKLYNLSFGPVGAIVDDSINRFTYVLDRLTYDIPDGDEHPLFCVAVGNDGDMDEPFNRVQSPADMVNGLGIGAYTFEPDNSKIRAPYSCVGSGREGAKTKPDFLEFGGSVDRPFVSAGMTAGTLSATAGTSFSTPLVVNKIGKLMAKSESITPHLGRTLLIHNAEVGNSSSHKEQGYGYCQEKIDDIVLCEDKKVTILYSGTLSPAQTVHLPIFSPKINSVKGMVNISWTIATIVDPYANDPDAYTNNCIEDVFIPHEMTYSFFKKNHLTGKLMTKKLNLLKDDDVDKAKSLLDQGFRRSDFPVSHPTKQAWNEADLRASDFKWDTVIRKQQRMRGSSLLSPALTLHAVARNGFDAHEIKYYVAISVEAPKYLGSLYDAILQTYQNLVPIEIRSINRILVDID